VSDPQFERRPTGEVIDALEAGIRKTFFDNLSSNVYTAVYGKVAPVPPTPPTRWQRLVGRVRRCWLDVRYWLAFRICPELEAWIDNGDL
jgi:hypothetical protein